MDRRKHMPIETRIDSLPTLFIPHGGGPCFFMDWTMGPPDTWHRMGNWLRSLSSSIGVRPKAIVVISGHWEEDEFAVGSGAKPSLIYDYSGFPPHTYQLKYDVPGSPALAKQVHDLLTNAGFPVRLDPQRGWDHGVFIPFKLIYPDADIPVLQLSLKAGLNPAEHIKAGDALQPLRKQGVLIVGSGMSYHNLRGFQLDGEVKASDQFDNWLTEAVTAPTAQVRNEMLLRWQAAPAAHQAHPREEHLIPLMVASGAAGQDQGHKVFQDRVMGAVVSAFQFGGL
jgi:aromatic ring-opening dioxygenase catalytic subunit (LigB family)